VSGAVTIRGPRPLRGHLRVPGEKGMSHRALIFGSIAHGPTTLTGLAPGEDVGRTVAALRALGVAISEADATVRIDASGVGSLREPDDPIDCGNSGTTLRMLAGLVAGREFLTILTGDLSLRRRPMARIIDPLRAMGARVDGAEDARAPLTIRGAPLTGRRLVLAQASGQVKTALVLAGLQAEGVTEIVEPAPSRDHTERMLASLGAPVERIGDRTLQVRRGRPRPFELELPGDPSSAAFLVVAATITPGSELVIDDVLLNAGRIGFVDALRAMGAAIEVEAREERLGERVGSIRVRSAPLHGAVISCTEPIIDEVPALAIAAGFAEGDTEFRDASELRVKESDRVVSVVDLLHSIGVEAEALADGLRVTGGSRPHPGHLRPHGDHRIALAAATAANALAGESTVEDWSVVSVSYPGFLDDLRSAAGDG
jgi:3-phosphoshikimate 1-carboxyvinyltransferase